MTFLLIVIIAILCIIAFGKTPVTARSNWQRYFHNLQFSAQEFLSRVEEELKARKIPALSMDRQLFTQTHFFSDSREYLRIQYREHHFFVSAVPFGTGSFVSWWLTEEEGGLLSNIPILNTFFGKNRKNKSYFQSDTEAAYKQAVHSVVVAVIDEFTKAQGLRVLSELEQQFNEGNRSQA